MPRGTYNVQEGMDVEASKQAGRDSSYRACLHAMLIFLAICVILLVAAWPWNSNKSTAGTPSNSTDTYNAGAIKGDEPERQSTTHGTTQRTTSTTPRTTTTKRGPPTTTENIARHADVKPVPDQETTTQQTTSIRERETTVPPPVVTTTTTTASTTPQEYTVSTTENIARHAIVNPVPDQETTNQPSEAAPTEATTYVDARDHPDDSKVTRVNIYSTVTEQQPTAMTDSNQAETLAGFTENDDTNDKYASASVSTHTESIAGQTTETVPITTSTYDSPTIADTSATNTGTEVTEILGISSSIVPPTKEPTGADSVCNTKQCKSFSVRVLSLMNHSDSVDPCEDFYEYACGGLRSNQALLEDDHRADINTRISNALNGIKDNSSNAHKTFKRYFESCINDSSTKKDRRIEQAREAVISIGQYIEDKSQPQDLNDLTSLISKLMLRHSTPLMDVILDVDGSNQSRFALKLTPPIFTSMFRPGVRRQDCIKPFNDTTYLNTVYETYTTCKQSDPIPLLKELATTLKDLNLRSILNTTDEHVLQDMELGILNLIEFLPLPGDIRQAMTGKDYKEMTIRQLQQTYSMVNWTRLVTNLLGRDLPVDTRIQVYFQDYLTKMFDHLKFEVPERKGLHNILVVWYAHELYMDLVTTQNACNRRDYCLQVAKELMEDVASSLYLSTFPPRQLADLSTEATTVFEELRTTLALELRDATWLDEASRSSVVGKLQSLKLEVDGAASVFLNATFLNERVKVIDQQEKSYLKLSIALMKRYRRQMYALYDVNPNDAKAIWTQFLNPYSTQGIVIYSLKKVVIPYGLMKWPMYEPSLPRYILMAHLGFVIAHEMAHHFDVNGIEYGYMSRDDSLLTQNCRSSYNQMIDCPKDANSFSNGSYRADDGRLITFKADVKLSRNERFADRSGAALAYNTYKSWVENNSEPQKMPYLGLSNEKTFLLTMAQIFCSKRTIKDYVLDMFEEEHAPPFLRVNSLMDNNALFSEAFKCHIGSKMNPERKCDVFPHRAEQADDDDMLTNPA